MMQKTRILALTLALLLTGCGAKPTAEPAKPAQPPAPSQQSPATPPAAQPEEKTELTVTVEGETETLPATLYHGDGWSICIPDEGWHPEQDTEDGVTETEWNSTDNDEVSLTVYCYAGYSRTGAMDLFVAEHDYVYEDLLGGTGAEDALTGADAEDAALCSFFCVESGGASYVVSWEYPQEAAEGFGARLTAMADTFAVA